jgi:catechol 2,3-dioxygenase-like lactoylglutathione lyase family enzyme
MAPQLDHLSVPARDRQAAAERLAQILGVPWVAETGIGPFSAVYVGEDLTLDFDQAEGDYPIQHYCFRLDEAGFDELLVRLRSLGVPYRSLPHGPVDGRVNTAQGGRIVYWDEPAGHVWEALTVSYARRR